MVMLHVNCFRHCHRPAGQIDLYLHGPLVLVVVVVVVSVVVSAVVMSVVVMAVVEEEVHQ